MYKYCTFIVRVYSSDQIGIERRRRPQRPRWLWIRRWSKQNECIRALTRRYRMTLHCKSGSITLHPTWLLFSHLFSFLLHLNPLSKFTRQIYSFIFPSSFSAIILKRERGKHSMDPYFYSQLTVFIYDFQ